MVGCPMNLKNCSFDVPIAGMSPSAVRADRAIRYELKAVVVKKWQLQEAKARFSELLDDTLEKGRQVVTRRGIDTAVVISIDEWHKLKDQVHVTWKEVLLGEGPRFEIPISRRDMVKARRPPVLD